MAVFPSFIDALIKGSPPAFKATGDPQHEYIEDSQNVGEFLEKLFGRLSALLFHIDRQINNVLIRGGRSPKKLNQWAMEARALKCQVSDLLKEQKKSAKCDELVEIGVRMITHLKKCPFKDEMMYDKPTPVIIRNLNTRLEEKYEVEESPEPILLPFQDSESSDMPGVVFSKSSAVDSDSASLSSFKIRHAVVSDTSPVGSDTSSLPKSGIKQRFADETAEMGTEAKMSTTMPISVVSSFTSQQRVDSDRHEEVQAVDEISARTYPKKHSIEQQETEPTSSNAEGNKHHEESVTSPIYFQEKGHYLVVLEDNHLQLKMDNQTISIADYPPANAMLNLAEQDLHELPGNKPNYPNSLILLLQRNKRLTLIHRSFFDTVPDLCFLDMSDTKIRILPTSLFELSKLKVLMLRNCICLDELPPEIGKLRHMEALDLSGTELYKVPDEIGQLTLMRSMQLSFYGPDDESEYEDLPSRLVSPSFLSELKGIEALSVSVHPEDHRWTKTVADMIKYISKLERLSYLHFYFPQVEMFESFIQTSPSWKKESLRKFEFTIGQNVKRIASRVPDEVESLFSREERCLRYVNGDKVSPLIKSALTQVTSFYLDHHTEARSLSEFGSSNFHELKFCLVRECPKMQAILDEKIAGTAFPCLEYLGIYFLWELKQVWKPVPQAGRVKRIFKTPTTLRSFEALRYLTISTCPKLRFILWESMLQCFANLEELVVEDCEHVEEIIKEEKKKVKYENNALPGLRKLVLRYLPELVGLGCGIRLSEEKISVYGCPKLIPNSLVDAMRLRIDESDQVSSSTEVELQKVNFCATPVENQGSEPTSTSESTLVSDAVVPKTFPVDSSSSSLSIEIKVIFPKTSEAKISEHHREIQEADDPRTSTDTKYSGEQRETEPTSSSNAKRSLHHEESIASPIYFQEEVHYLVVLKDNKHLRLEFNNQSFLIGDYPSAVNPMLNLVEQDLHELPGNKPNYPNSLILLLQRNKRLSLIHRSFFDTMPDLSFLDLSDTKIRNLPSSLFELSKLKVLLLRNCICLEKLPPEVRKLSSMEALDLSGTELYELPDEIGELTLMRSVQLSFYGPDDESEYDDLPSRLVSPSFLSELKGIEALSVSVHPEDRRWTKTVADMIKDVSRLERLSYLHFYFPQVETFESFIQTSPSWKKQNLRKFEFTVGQTVKRITSRVPDEVESLFSRKGRCLRYVNGDKVSPLIKSALTQVTSFYLDHHTAARSLSEFDSSNFHELKFCLVRECPKMEAILDEENAGSAFPCLEYLGIYFLWELKHIWKPVPQAGRVKRICKTPSPSRNFEALKHLIISTCPKLRFIFWESMLQCLTNLEELIVEDCEHVEKIIKEENKKVKCKNVLLPRLRKLVLRYLPELVGLGCGIRLSKEKISVYGCPKLIPNSLVDAMRRLTIDECDQWSSSTQVELQKENVGATPVENQGSEPTSTSESTLVPDAVVPQICGASAGRILMAES